MRRRSSSEPLGWIVAVFALLAFACACGRHVAPQAELSHYAYALTIPPSGSWILGVDATFEQAPSARLVLPDGLDAIKSVVQVLDDHTVALAPEAGAFVVPPCRRRCLIRYQIDLEALQALCGRFDCPRKLGEAVFGPSSSWMLRPEPAGDAILHLEVAGGDRARFSTGLRRDDHGGYVFRASELAESSYSAFGAFRRRRIRQPPGAIDATLLGEPLAMGDDAALQWVGDGASCVGQLFGRFPVDASVFVLPLPGADHVVFGRVMSLAGASVMLLFGSQTAIRSEHDDWVVVHELFHLGMPSFVGEGRWLEEGLATYYEPILRARAGWTSEEALWQHFVQEMPRGLRRADEAASIEERDDIDSTYWGGALFALLADVRIRKASGGTHSLDDVVRAAFAQMGDATHVGSVARFLSVGDATVGGHVLADLYAGYAVRGEAVDLEALWKELGVDGEPQRPLHEAPFASLRHAISSNAGVRY